MMLRRACVSLVLSAGVSSLMGTLVAADDSPVPGLLPMSATRPTDAAPPARVAAEKILGNDGGEKLAQLVRTLDGGCYLHKFPSGVGTISIGKASYDVAANPTATRLQQRQAAMTAYTRAKRNLGAFSKGTKLETDQSLKTMLRTVSTNEADLTNTLQSMKEGGKEFISANLSGLVVYDQIDNGGEVRITVVSSPRTTAAIKLTKPNVVNTGTLAEGIQWLEAQLRSGVTPMAGAG